MSKCKIAAREGKESKESGEEEVYKKHEKGKEKGDIFHAAASNMSCSFRPKETGKIPEKTVTATYRVHMKIIPTLSCHENHSFVSCSRLLKIWKLQIIIFPHFLFLV